MSRKHWISLDEAREMEEWMWKALQERAALGHEWERDRVHDCYQNDPWFSFEAGGAVKFTVSAGRSLWLHINVNGKEHEGGDFNKYPRALMLKWNRSARETAHNILAIVQVAVFAMERREGLA